MHNIMYVIRTMDHKIMCLLLIYKSNRVIRKQPNFSVRVRYCSILHKYNKSYTFDSGYGVRNL